MGSEKVERWPYTEPQHWHAGYSALALCAVLSLRHCHLPDWDFALSVGSRQYDNLGYMLPQVAGSAVLIVERRGLLCTCMRKRQHGVFQEVTRSLLHGREAIIASQSKAGPQDREGRATALYRA